MKPDLSKYKDLPRFADGRINYHESSSALGLNCLVTYKKEILVLKRSMNPGFAGVDNQLYTRDNTMMVFGDAKSTITQIMSNNALITICMIRIKKLITLPQKSY